MIKKCCGVAVTLFCFLVFVGISEANDYEWVMGGSEGYLSTSSSVALFFNANPGDKIVLAALPMDYSSTEGYCGLARMGNSTLIVHGFSTEYLFATAFIDDLYLFLCLKYSGLPGNMLLISGDAVKLGMAQSDTLSTLSERKEMDSDFIIRLQHKMQGLIDN